jgi:hypothetical protein
MIVGVHKGRIYCGTDKGFIALDLATGKVVDHLRPKLNILSATLQGHTIYAIIQEEGMALGRSKPQFKLCTIDIETKYTRSLMNFSKDYPHITVDAERLYLSRQGGLVEAYSLKKWNLIWKKQLQITKQEGRNASPESMVQSNYLLLKINSAGYYCLDTRTGKTLWHQPAEYAALYATYIVGDKVVSQSGNLFCMSLKTGKILWNAGESFGEYVCFKNTVVCIAHYRPEWTGLDLQTGKVLWKKNEKIKAIDFAGRDAYPVLEDATGVWLMTNPLTSVNEKGNILWKQDKPVAMLPLYADGNFILTGDSDRILCYRHGSNPTLPKTAAKRKAYAEYLASHFEELDGAEMAQLNQLVPYSFRPLLKYYLKKATLGSRTTLDSGELMRIVGLSYALKPYLLSTFQEQDTQYLIDIIPTLADDLAKSDLQAILSEKGNTKESIPALIQSLRNSPGSVFGENYKILQTLSRSRHPQAVAFMLESLGNPKAPEAWRDAAFTHLAGTGGQKGIEAVRNARRKQRANKPWYVQIDLTTLKKYEYGQTILATKKDSQGRVWTLFRCSILGNRNDLFIMEKRGERWERPIFTGAWNKEKGDPFDQPKLPDTFRGIKVKDLIATEWIKIFPDDPTIRKDSDGDGLTDIVEARIGTDPHKADTDGDRLNDAVDPCPNAAPRPMGDTEKIVAACLEAHYFGSQYARPAVLKLDMKPFEVPASPNMIIWQTPQNPAPFNGLFGGGFNSLSIGGFRYSTDHRTVKVSFGRVSGGLNGNGSDITLKKIGEEWFVIDIQETWIS